MQLFLCCFVASIKKLITLAGGCVERRNCTCNDAKVVNIVDIDDNLLELEYYRDKTKTSQVVVIEWLFDCLTEYKILDTSPYTVTNEGHGLESLLSIFCYSLIKSLLIFSIESARV